MPSIVCARISPQSSPSPSLLFISFCITLSLSYFFSLSLHPPLLPLLFSTFRPSTRAGQRTRPTGPRPTDRTTDRWLRHRQLHSCLILNKMQGSRINTHAHIDRNSHTPTSGSRGDRQQRKRNTNKRIVFRSILYLYEYIKYYSELIVCNCVCIWGTITTNADVPKWVSTVKSRMFWSESIVCQYGMTIIIIIIMPT